MIAVAGALQAVSIAAPWNGQPLGWLQLLSMAIFAVNLNAAGSWKTAAAWGWLFAWTWLTGALWWLYVAMHTYAGLPVWIAVLAVIALTAALSIYYGAAVAAYHVWRPSNAYAAAALFAVCWMMAELARGTWLTGFGWGAIGYAHVNMLARASVYLGSYGVAALVAAMASLMAATWTRKHWQSAATTGAAAIAIGTIMAVNPPPFTVPTKAIQVALLQGNIAQGEKFEPGTGIADALQWYGANLAATSAPLVIAPETAIPVLPEQLPASYWENLRQHAQTQGRGLLFGVPLGSTATGYTNSVVAITGAATTDGSWLSYRYDKHHLVPFGEFIPPFFRWFTEMMNIPLGDFSRGALGQPSFHWQGQRLAPNICYEDLFGEELGQRFQDPKTEPTIFMNVSNIAWFGDTVAIDQHLQISRMRVLEFQRPFIRATNTGDTAIIDHTGRVLQRLPRLTRGTLVGEVEGRQGITPYAWWVSRWGLWPLWLLGLAVIAVCAMAKRRRASSPSPNGWGA